MIRVIVLSPYSGTPEEIAVNIRYAVACMRDCLTRGEAPFLSHLQYPQALDDTQHAQRELGMEAGREWFQPAQYVVEYTDRGRSAGMALDLAWARRIGKPVVERALAGWAG